MKAPIWPQFACDLVLSSASLYILWCGGQMLAPSAFAAQEKGEVIQLKEISVFTNASQTPDQNPYIRGQEVSCSSTASSEVKHYPAFQSAKPLYGSVRFDTVQNDPKSGTVYYFAVDEADGTGKGYNRLYFDFNRDLDLANDPPHKVVPTIEDAKLSWSDIKQQVFFENLAVPFDLGSGTTRPVEILPRLIVTEGYSSLSFVRTKAYRGETDIAGIHCIVELGNDYTISGRLDRPTTVFRLRDRNGSEPNWWEGNRLMAIHKIAGKYYQFTATPEGDKLTVTPYEGELGTLEVGPGKRTLKKMDITGSILSANTAVAVGGEMEGGSPKPAQTCQLPVGDYLPNYYTIHYGDLRLSMSRNYHSEGKSMDVNTRTPVYDIKIRKDKPFVIDFTVQPVITFISPTNLQRVQLPKNTQTNHLGETLMVKAVLVDPSLDAMIRRLDDTTKEAKARSLDPKVIITRANGEKVAEGVMPFG